MGHRKEFQNWLFERWRFVRANGGTVGCVCVYMQKIEILELKALVDTLIIKSADLRDKFLL